MSYCLHMHLIAMHRVPYPPHTVNIMAYGSTPYVGMAPKKNGGHIKSAQMTRSKCLVSQATPLRRERKGLVTLQPSSCRHDRNLSGPIRFVDCK